MSGEMQPTSIIAFASQVSSSVPVWKAEAKTVPARHQHEISNSLDFHLKQGNWKKENIQTVSNSLQEAIFRWLFALVSVILLGENLFQCSSVGAPNELLDLVEIAAMDLDDELFSRQKAQKLAQKEHCTATTTRGHGGTEGNLDQQRDHLESGWTGTSDWDGDKKVDERVMKRAEILNLLGLLGRWWRNLKDIIHEYSWCLYDMFAIG